MRFLHIPAGRTILALVVFAAPLSAAPRPKGESKADGPPPRRSARPSTARASSSSPAVDFDRRHEHDQ